MDTVPSRRLNNHVPPGTGMFGLKVFLASLTVLFGASLVAYLLIRSQAKTKGLAYGTLRLPASLWLSTVVMIASSLVIRSAVRAVREDRQAAFRRAMVATAFLGLLFLTIQVPSLYLLLLAHAKYSGQNVFLYGLILLLIALHALHVVGGLVPLGITTGRALRGGYDVGHYEAVQYCAVYWHFLDVVWLVMFGLLFLTG